MSPLPRICGVCALLLCGTFASYVRADGGVNLLAGKPALRALGARRVEALDDGRAIAEGGPWKTLRSCMFADAQSFVVFDLGALHEVHGAWLSGDNNDTYRVELSGDGHRFTTLWDAGPQRRSGMVARQTQLLSAAGRYVRVRPLSGDGNFAISELQLWGDGGQAPAEPERLDSVDLDRRLRDRILLFGLALLPMLLVPARARGWHSLLAFAVAGWGCFQLAKGVSIAWPVAAPELSLLRATIACLGAAAVMREAFAPRRWPAQPLAIGGVLALCAALGVLAFYNLGHAQFYNTQAGRWSFAHYADLRQYYPTAKYFRELGYVGLYDADLAAYGEQRRHGLEGLSALPVRDLETFEIAHVADRTREIAAAEPRFSAARWAAYRHDSDWFRRTMGDEMYLDTLVDYGGNAPPTWIAIAHVLFTLIAPSDAAFTWLGLIDPLLLAVMFGVMLRTFGWRTALLCALVFGANDFVMYGNNWGGATLRHDWLAYLGLGACALRRERWAIGGALLGLAATIRAFPALALIGAALPALLRVSEHAVRERRWPRLSELMQTERATVRIALGAACALLAAVLFSTLVIGAGSWSDWIDKVVKIEGDPHPASVALRNLIAGSDDQAHILRARWPVYAALIAFYAGATALVSRHLRVEQAAVLGLSMVPVLLYPATYYLHLVFLWPLLASGARPIGVRDALLWLIALGMCAAEYFTTLASDMTLHFYLSTACLFAALTALLCALLAQDPSVRAWFAREPAR